MNLRALEPSALAMLKWMHGPQATFEHFAPGIKAGLLEQAQECITAYEAHLKAEGFVVVPVIPTPAMIESGCDNNPTSWNEGTDLGFAADVANDVYRAMVAAAQEPTCK